MRKIDTEEFYNIMKPYLNHPKVLELKNHSHHGTTRYDHSFRVAYYTYFLSKKFHLNYISATKAALLHDFYFDEVNECSRNQRYRYHPSYAVYNAKKYFDINDMEKDIIEKHMFPFTLKIPKYRESWIVDFVDDFSAIYERGKMIQVKLQPVLNIILLGFLMILD